MSGGINIFDEEVGLPRRGTIIGVNQQRGTMQVQLNISSSIKGSRPKPVDVPLPHAMFYNNGMFIGTLPNINTPVVVSQGSGGQYYFVSFLAETLSLVPTITLGQMLLQSNNSTKITLDDKNNISAGSDNNKIHLNTLRNLITTNFYNHNDFTQGTRLVKGLIKRDLKPNINFTQESKLDSDDYDSRLYLIGLDPTVSPNSIISGSSKNPPFVEHREMTYEFQNISQVGDEFGESLLYGNTPPPPTNYTFPNRRVSRSDTLSLTLAAPNYLMEQVKGTVVDIFGNILDLNRLPLGVGANQQITLRPDQGSDKSDAYINIRALERRSLAYHFELNARKDLSGSNGQIVLPDINSNTDYARNRSRFFLDIDKEGQFKLNVPASSETGNIALLTRYENYSTFGAEDNGNPNKLVFRDDNLDIFQDSFSAPIATPTTSGFSYATERGSIQLKDGNADGAPLDRITQAHIKHGTAYHDLLQTCYVHQNNQFIDYQAGTTKNITIDLSTIIPLTNVVSNVINISGTNANAGGRSGSFNFDGSVEMNIGANTIDRQSLWLDTAGGVVANLGRDLMNRSAMISANGDVYFQVGGFGVSTDSRFVKQNNSSVGAILDLRVMTDGGYVHMLRFDKNGIRIMSPTAVAIHAKGDMKLSSDANIEIEAETLTLQGRMVLKNFGGSI